MNGSVTSDASESYPEHGYDESPNLYISFRYVPAQDDTFPKSLAAKII
jgi:hypothetical protein